MALTKKDFSAYIKQFNFKELFNDMGWNNDKISQHITIDNITYSLKAVAEKSGFKILVCNPTEAGTIPDYNARKKIETKLTKLFQEHLIIFVDAKKQEQIWQLVVRQSGKPAKVTETRYHVSQDPELLFQRAAGIFFEMDEEENITIVDVTKRVADNFHQNNERVTKQFYESFKKQHTSFLSFIKGIEGKADKDWYASLMLNRLMFCYFIQKKGFLDNNKNYLRQKLNLCKEKRGKDKFYSFYRSFLLVLFHEGLNEPAQKEKIKIEIGKIPYLNGGLFDEHELEKSYEIDIDDKAFERIFDFFDQYEWHLDTRIEATGKDINPDVIGYIFEKYINDRAQMGAYYTKEDITDYISKNCIIPWLFDETTRNYPKAFAAQGEIWTSLKQSGDTYIYNAVKYGTDLTLPKNIEAGIKDVAKRTDWNKQATSDMGLPTEIWREVVERRNRYEEVKKKIESGVITAINDFITYNLNIRQFTQDIIENSDDPDFIQAFYKAIISVTIIDPTCGSGAFLFAAMNILEPLYHACIMRMRAFTEDEDRENEQEKKTFKNKYKYFREVLENIQSEQHPNLQYFIYKSIILNNLYGVDIMKEAVEIAKLRLFLKLVATVEADYKKKNLGLEPLPDIDFNIRPGNTLIGFATIKELKTGSLDFQEDEKKALEELEKVSMAFKRFKEIQLSGNSIDFIDFKKAKIDYQNRLNKLKVNLNNSYYNAFGNHKLGYKYWHENHQPFHWFAEYFEIIKGNNGFDVIIGNPPYVAFKDINYNPPNYETVDCGDIYALCIERSIKSLLNKSGRIGMIVPISIASTDGYSSLRKVCNQSNNGFYFSNFGVRPAKLFDGVDKRLTIFISSGSKNTLYHSTKYYRWVSDERDTLFEKLKYVQAEPNLFGINGFPKLSSDIEASIIKSLKKKKSFISNFVIKTSAQKVRYTRKLQYFIQFFEEPPVIYDAKKNVQTPSELKELSFVSETQKDIALSALNSSLFFWFFIAFSDCRNVNSREILKFPIDIDSFSKEQTIQIRQLSKKLMKDFKANSVFQNRNDKRAGLIEIESFQPRLSKFIIDQIDTLLAENYGLNSNELDFIINYDVKYRMGRELENDEDE